MSEHIVTGEVTLQVTVSWNGYQEKAKTELGDWVGEEGLECTCGETFTNTEDAADHVWEEEH